MIVKCTGQTPAYAKAGDAGADIVSQEVVCIHPHEDEIISTGLHVEIPTGYVGLVCPRSGHRFKHHLESSPGIIDSGYRGEVKIHLWNHGEDCYLVQEGERIAQILIMPVVQAKFIQFDELDESDRGSGGFGSTGK